MYTEVAYNALNNIISQLTIFLPKLVFALLIWYFGKYLLNLVTGLIRKFDVKDTDIDDKAIEFISVGVNIIGRIILVLIILDFLGIGSSVVGAIAQSMTLAIAIALGMSFGRALEDDAKRVVKMIKDLLHK